MLKNISQILDIHNTSIFDEEHILENLTKLKETAIRKQEPIFVERIKEIKVPITVEKIVEKVVQKLVYVEKPVEKAVFKEKVVEKFI